MRIRVSQDKSKDVQSYSPRSMYQKLTSFGNVLRHTVSLTQNNKKLEFADIKELLCSIISDLIVNN